MPRKLLQRTDTLPYHVTARANNRENFHLPLQHFWKILGNEGLNLSIVHEVEVHALVLMPNHFHMLLTVPQYDLGKVMNTLMCSIVRSSNLKTGRTGHIFGGPYHWSLINSSRYFGHALKYVYRNPVKAGLCTHVEDYPFSTLNGLVGQSHLPFPIHYTRVGMELALPSVEAFEQLNWLNQPFPKEAETLIQKGLRKKIFKGAIDLKTRTPMSPLDHLL